MHRIAATLSLFLTFVVILPAVAEEPAFHVMIANDDGVDAPGIEALITILAKDPTYRITVIAPLTQQSAKSHALVIHGEVAVRHHEKIVGCTTFSVDATPASTVRLGLGSLLIDDPPDLVLSGINKGENVGRVSWYSGTVGGAREAVLFGTPAIALSLQLDWEAPDPDWENAAKWAKVVVDSVRLNALPEGVYLNVNIPRVPSKARGVRMARMGLEPDQLNEYKKVREENGVSYYKAAWYPPADFVEGTDNMALNGQWVTVAPLGLDATHYQAFAEIAVLKCLGEYELSSSN